MIFLLPFLVFMIPFYFAFRSYDRLIRFEYEYHRADWENDGKPFGYVWRPPEIEEPMGSLLAFWRCGSKWLFKTPAWMSQDIEAMRLLKRFRQLNILASICVPLYLLSELLLVYLFG